MLRGCVGNRWAWPGVLQRNGGGEEGPSKPAPQGASLRALIWESDEQQESRDLASSVQVDGEHLMFLYLLCL